MLNFALRAIRTNFMVMALSRDNRSVGVPKPFFSFSFYFLHDFGDSSSISRIDRLVLVFRDVFNSSSYPVQKDGDRKSKRGSSRNQKSMYGQNVKTTACPRFGLTSPLRDLQIFLCRRNRERQKQIKWWSQIELESLTISASRDQDANSKTPWFHGNLGDLWI